MHRPSIIPPIRGKRLNELSKSGSKELPELMDLFQEQIIDIYSVEKALANVLPYLIKKANSNPLTYKLTVLLKQTKKLIISFEEIFLLISKIPEVPRIHAKNTLLRDTIFTLETTKDHTSYDAIIIHAVQTIGIYECATFHIIHEIARKLDLTSTINLLESLEMSLSQRGLSVSNSSWFCQIWPPSKKMFIDSNGYSFPR